MNPNGSDLNSRITRIEELIVLLTNRQVAYEESHISFEQEHKQLLIAQVVLTDRLDKLAVRMDQLAGRMDQLADAQRRADERMDKLIAVVDGLARRDKPAE